MADHSGENWIEVYQKALTELEHAKMRGRIGDARVEIIARVEKLKKIPGLHAQEDQAIEDALNALRFLEREGALRRKPATPGFRNCNAETAIHPTKDQEVGRVCFGIDNALFKNR